MVTGVAFLVSLTVTIVMKATGTPIVLTSRSLYFVIA